MRSRRATTSQLVAQRGPLQLELPVLAVRGRRLGHAVPGHADVERRQRRVGAVERLLPSFLLRPPFRAAQHVSPVADTPRRRVAKTSLLELRH
eukprot:14788162-Heterocapsa_arctica.AAC.1